MALMWQRLTSEEFPKGTVKKETLVMSNLCVFLQLEGSKPYEVFVAYFI